MGREEDLGQERPSLSAELYDERYYTICEGYDEFVSQDGLGLPRRLEVALELAELEPEMQVLDMGCGRGEVLFHSANEGTWAWGLDYSPAAAVIARRAARQLGGAYERQTAAQVGNVKTLAFPDNTFDRVFMLDLVEHLYPWELEFALAEAWRVLRDEGRLIVHTMPNRWYYMVGYPVYRLLNRLIGRHLPKNPRTRTEYNEHVHVNEQDVLRLRRSLRQAGFEAKVQLENLHPQSLGQGTLASVINRLVRLPGLRLFLCNDLLAIGTKKRRRP